ncbi:MAG: serine protease, partial [Sphingomonas sp.]
MTARMGLAIAGALLLAGCAQGPERVVEPRESMAPAPRGASLLKTTMMDGHNAARAAVGVAPLTWSDTLATTARAYA